MAETNGVTTPESSEELAEILADEKRSQAVFANPETRRSFLDSYVREVNKSRPDIKQQIQDGLKEGLSTALEEWGVDVNRPDVTVNISEIEQPKNKFYNKRAVGAGKSTDGTKSYDSEFDGWPDFLKSTWHQNHLGQDRWRRIRNDYSSLDAASGGFLVPEVLRAELLRVALETAIVRSRARVIPMDSARVPFPTIDSTSNASTVFGGISGYWTEEGGSLTESEATFGRVVLDASKLTAYSEVPNELLQDSIVSFAAFIDSVFPAAIAWFEDIAFIRGHGVGQPLGVMNSPALVSVAKETGQAADTIVWENLVKMFSRMLPASLGSAVWVANIDTFPQLATMSLAVGTGGSAIWLNNGIVGPPMTILGRPLIFTEKMETLGGGGSGKDIAFIDFGYYLIGDRMQMRAENSPHVKFQNDITAYRIIERVDGRGWIQSAITPNKGTNTLSPFVTLDERA
jgi:HK97 family phage major capsid protein